jgi:hypothetical protein
MPVETLDLEGTWEEILAHRDELRGARVRLTAWRHVDDPSPLNENRRMLAWLDDLQEHPWTPDEEAILDGLEGFRREHPVQFRTPDDLT